MWVLRQESSNGSQKSSNEITVCSSTPHVYNFTTSQHLTALHSRSSKEHNCLTHCFRPPRLDYHPADVAAAAGGSNYDCLPPGAASSVVSMRRVSHPPVRQSLAGSAVLSCVFTLQTNTSSQTPHLLWTRADSESGEAAASAQQQVVLSAKGEPANLLIGSAAEETRSLRSVFFHRCMELSWRCL